MNKTLEVALVALVLVLIFSGCFYWLSLRQKSVKKAKADYKNALQSGNKQEALLLGRKYYSMLRGGNLSTYDEQAISNDLSTMK